MSNLSKAKQKEIARRYAGSLILLSDSLDTLGKVSEETEEAINDEIVLIAKKLLGDHKCVSNVDDLIYETLNP